MKTTIRLTTFAILLCTLFIGKQSLAQSKTSSEAHPITNEALKEYAGNYKKGEGPGFDITISLEGDDKLMAQPTDKRQPNTLMIAKAKDKFDLLNTGGLVITFTRQDDKIISLTFSQGGQSFTATKSDE